MELKPEGPPGRKTRKAREYAGEIQRLAAVGYSLDAIRQALLAAGIAVSKSTVQREASRKPSSCRVQEELQRSLAACTVLAHNTLTVPPAPWPDSQDRTTCAPFPRSHGRDVAEAFFLAHPSSSLLRPQEEP